jgi:hypothetical protein
MFGISQVSVSAARDIILVGGQLLSKGFYQI